MLGSGISSGDGRDHSLKRGLRLVAQELPRRPVLAVLPVQVVHTLATVTHNKDHLKVFPWRRLQTAGFTPNTRMWALFHLASLLGSLVLLHRPMWIPASRQIALQTDMYLGTRSPPSRRRARPGWVALGYARLHRPPLELYPYPISQELVLVARGPTHLRPIIRRPSARTDIGLQARLEGTRLRLLAKTGMGSTHLNKMSNHSSRMAMVGGRARTKRAHPKVRARGYNNGAVVSFHFLCCFTLAAQCCHFNVYT